MGSEDMACDGRYAMVMVGVTPFIGYLIPIVPWFTINFLYLGLFCVNRKLKNPNTNKAGVQRYESHRWRIRGVQPCGNTFLSPGGQICDKWRLWGSDGYT